MSRSSLADAKNGLPGLIDQAPAGDEVVITRHGKPAGGRRRRFGTSPRLVH